MARQITIYQTWNEYDSAQEDTFHETLADAAKFLRTEYGAKGPIRLNDRGAWDGEGDDGNGVHLRRHEITLTRAELCHAFRHIPMR